MNTTAPTSGAWSSADCVPTWRGPLRGARAVSEPEFTWRIDATTPSVTLGRRRSSFSIWAAAPAAMNATQATSQRSRRATLFRQALDEERGGKQRARRAERPEPAIVDAPDLAAAVQACEHPVDCEAQVGVAARQHERVLLDGKVLVEQLVRIAARGALHDQTDQGSAVRGHAVDLALAQELEALVAGLDAHDLGGDEVPGQRLPQRSLGRRAPDHRDALAAEIGEAPRIGIDLQEHARAVQEGDQAEVDQALAPQRPRGSAALDVDLLAAHGDDAVLDRELHPARFELASLELSGDAVGDRAAQLDRISLRLAVGVGVGKRRRAVDVAERDYALLADLVERLRFRGCGERSQRDGRNQKTHLF